MVGSPGPATLSCAAAGASFGQRESRPYLLGLISGAALVISGVAAGLLTAVLAIPFAATALTMVSIIYLSYLAFKIATAPPVGDPTASTNPPGYITGVVLNLSNPKAYAAFAALFAGFELLPQTPIASAILEAVCALVILIIVNLCWWSTGSALQQFFHDPKLSRIINISFAVLLVASVLATVLLSEM